MKAFTSILLSVGLATAIPAPLTTPNDSASSLTKRISKQSNCGLDMYQNIDEGQMQIGIRTLIRYKGYDERDNDWQDIIWGVPGKCKLIWCNGGTGISFCLDKTDDMEPKPYDPVQLGTNIDDTFKDCNGRLPRKNKGEYTRAIQYWGDGYNVLAQGNMDCKMRNKVL